MTENATFGQEAGALTKAAGLVTEARGDFDREVKILEGHMESLRVAWGGKGAKACQDLMEEWNARQLKINGVLDNFSDSLKSTENTNFVTDDDAAASLKSVNVSETHTAARLNG